MLALFVQPTINSNTFSDSSKSDIIIQSLLLELRIKPALGLRVRREWDTTTREEALQAQHKAHTDTEISRGITSTV